MKWDVIIDDQSLLDTWGGIVLQGGLNAFLSWPGIKSVDMNDWAEENGIEVDLSEVHFTGRQFSVNVYFKTFAQMQSFTDYMTEQHLHVWAIPALDNATMRLRVTSVGHPDHGDDFCVVQLGLAEDVWGFLDYDEAPLDLDDQLLPSSGVSIDDVDLSEFGLRVLYGSMNGLIDFGDIKPALARASKATDGVLYDNDAYVHTTSKGLSFRCLLKHSSVAAGVHNYMELLRFLTRPDEGNGLMGRCLRTLHLGRGLDKTYRCYYQSGQIEAIHIDDDAVWLEFHINLLATE